MKTLYAVLFTSLLIFSAACGNDSSSENEDSHDADKSTANADSDKGDSKDQKQQDKQKKMLMDWELDMIAKIHKAEEPFKGLDPDAVVQEGKDVDQDAVKDSVKQVNDAVDNLEKSIEDMKVPSKLDEDMQENLKAAASDLAASYKARADKATDLKGISSAKKYQSKVDDMNKAGDDKFDGFNNKVNKAENKLDIEGETDFSEEQ